MAGTSDPHLDSTIFGLPATEIQALVAAAVGSALDACRLVERSSDLPGLAAEKVVARFAYRTASGAEGHIRLFWKRMYGLDIAEAHQYRFLADHDVPTPKLYGTAFGTKEEEIIVIEVLDAVGIERDDPREVREYLSLLAQLNAVRLRSEDPWKPPAHEIGRQLAEGKTMAARVERIWIGASAGEFGDELKRWCSTHASVGETLVRRGVEHGSRLRRLPRAILHEDYAPPNIGWRAGRKELVVFDLHRLSLGPRFWDAGLALGPRSAPAFSCLPWEELALHYLAELERFGGSGAPPDIFEEELVLARKCAELDDLKWNLRSVLYFRPDGTAQQEQHALRERKGLLERLEFLAQRQ